MDLSNITQTEWAYTAGLMDGEGLLSARMMKPDKLKLNTRMAIGNTNLEVIN